MFSVTYFLVFLIAATPAMVVFQGPFVDGSVSAAAAVMSATVALRIPSGETGFLLAVIRPVAIAAAVAALWILAQILPLESLGLANPMWKSAGEALGHRVGGSISVDPGLTLLAFSRLLAFAAIAFVAAAVAVDRRRAEWVLFILAAAATVVALMVLIAGFGGLALLDGPHDGAPARAAATDIAGLGVILSAAAALHAFERGKTRRPGQLKPAAWIWPAFWASLGALAICVLAVVISAANQTIFAIAVGIATLAIAVMVRRFNIGAWGISAILSVVFLLAIAAAAVLPGIRNVELTLAFAAHAPPGLVAATERILSDSIWTGTGAGTFSAMLPIYRDINELSVPLVAPTTAAKIAVEMGQPFLLTISIGAMALAAMLLHGAFKRHRESIFSIAGASCVVAVTLLAFSDAAVIKTPVLTIAAAVVGMALAQRRSRSA